MWGGGGSLQYARDMIARHPTEIRVIYPPAHLPTMPNFLSRWNEVLQSGAGDIHVRVDDDIGSIENAAFEYLVRRLGCVCAGGGGGGHAGKF